MPSNIKFVPDFGDLLRSARAQFVAALDKGLQSGAVNVKDNETFTRILTTAITTCGLDQNELADLLETSHTSISRWKSGKALPHPQYRLPLVMKLREKVEEMSFPPARTKAPVRR